MGYPYAEDSSSMNYFVSDGSDRPAAFGVPISKDQLGKILGVDLTRDQLTDPKFVKVAQKAQELADELKSTLKAIEDEKAAQNLPSEPKPEANGNRYVTFTKKYDGSRCYHYVAIRPHGKTGWTISGRTAMGTDVPWAKLLEFIQKDERDPKAMLMTLRTMSTGSYLTR